MVKSTTPSYPESVQLDTDSPPNLNLISKKKPNTAVNIEHHNQLMKIFSEHIGKTNTISSKEISRLLKIKDAAANPITRDIITEFIEKSGLPIGATGTGYYVISSENELLDYLENLQHRIAGITNRKKLIIKNWYKV